MKLKLMSKSAVGGKVLLCTEDGEPLPNQLKVRLISEPDDLVRVEVVFLVGDDLVLDSGD